MKKEFMLLIRNRMNHLAHLSPEENQNFLKACQSYIGKLTQEGKLKAAQPLIKEGVIISGTGSDWKQTPFNESNEVQVGYYHILADSLDEAIEIAKANPEFAFTSTARIEVRPIKMMEQTTSFVYPGKNL